MIDLLHSALAATVLAAPALGTQEAPPAQEVAPPPPPPPAQAKSLNSFNPQISLITDFRWEVADNAPGAERRIYMKEAELGLAADVDPYLKAEAYIAFHDEDGETVAEVEEAFGKYNNLGPGLSAKFGIIAGAIGRVQRNHADQQNWLDFPLVIQDFLGEEGLRAGGASLSYLLPGEKFHELTFEVMDTKDEGLFAGAHSGAPAFIGHYRTFFDFSEDASAQVGLTYANGPGGFKRNRSQLFGVDLTYKFQPGTRGKSLVFESEAYWGKPGERTGQPSDSVFGTFAALTYQFAPRLFGTLKYDYSEIPFTSDKHSAWSLGATLKVTEFHHWRAMFQTISSNFAPRQDRLTLQFQWNIGAHPAHKY